MTREDAIKATIDQLTEHLEKQHLTKQEMKNQIIGLESRDWMLVHLLKDAAASAYIHIEILAGLVAMKDLQIAVESTMQIINRLEDMLEELTHEKQWTVWLQPDDAERCGFAGLTFGNGTFEVLTEADRPQEGR